MRRVISFCPVSIGSASLFPLWIFLLALPGSSQDGESAFVVGSVTDVTGALLPNVSVLLTSDHSRTISRCRTGIRGDFFIPFLSAGTYTLTAEHLGFVRLTMPGIHLGRQQGLRLRLVLQVESLVSEVTVSALGTLVDTQGSTIRTTLTKQQVVDLPILTTNTSRSATDKLVILTPGASSLLPQFQMIDFVSINGSPYRGLGFALDGVDYSDHHLPVMTYSPRSLISQSLNPDAIGEFSVLSHTFKAEAGSRPALVNFTTKQGTEDFHGQIRALDLEPKFGSRDFFDLVKKSESAIRSIGFQLSGPLALPNLHGSRRQTRFLLDLERSYWRFESTNSSSVPDRAQRSGDFSALPTNLWPKDPLTGSVFPNGRIPSGRILPQARFFIDEFIPLPTEGNQWIRTLQNAVKSTQLTLRLDHRFSSGDSLSATAFFSPYHPKISNASFQAGLDGRQGTQNLVVHYTRRLAAPAVNVLTFGRSEASADMPVVGKHREVDLASYGFNIQRLDSSYTGFPRVSLRATGMFSPPGETWKYGTSVWTVKNALSLQRRTHSLKFGGESRWVRSTIFLGAAPDFEFTDLNPFGTGQEAADLLLGIPYSYVQRTSRAYRPRKVVASWFVQDDYQLRPGLTLSAGLRQEINGVSSEKVGRYSLFRPGVQSRVFLNAPQGMIFPGDEDPVAGRVLGTGFNPPDHNNLAPRIGLAWAPDVAAGLWRPVLGEQGKSAIRLGYGVFYILNQHLSIFNGSAPWETRIDRTATELKESAATFAKPWGNMPDPFLQPANTWPIRRPVNGTTFLERTLPEAYQHQWTLSVQRELPANFLAELAYVGNRGIRLHRQYLVNRSPLTPGSAVFNIFDRRMYPEFNRIYGLTADGTSSYNAMQVMVARRFGPRFQMSGNYVWSKALGNADGGNGINMADRDTTTWARTLADRRHSLAWSGFVALPSAQRSALLWRTVSGWKASAIVQMATGIPLNLRNGVDSTLQGVVSEGMPDIIDSFRRLNPRDLRTFVLPNGSRITGNFLFDPTAFRTVLPAGPHEARLGNLGRNVFSGPGTNLVDLSLLKQMRLGERQSIEFRADVTNVFNHANFSSFPPTVSTAGSSFGRTLSTYGPRRVQLYLRYQF